MYKLWFFLSIPTLIVANLSTAASAADLTLTCNGVVRRLGGAFERNLQLELEFFRPSASYKLYQYEEKTKKVIGTGKAEFEKGRILLGDRNWSIDRKTGIVSYGQSGGMSQDFSELRCQAAADGKTIF
jgi:hypothetical protein